LFILPFLFQSTEAASWIRRREREDVRKRGREKKTEERRREEKIRTVVTCAISRTTQTAEAAGANGRRGTDMNKEWAEFQINEICGFCE
jgi:hypothetical protein